MSTQTSALRRFDRGIKVRIRSLSQVCSQLNIHDGILKLDCEGCEYDAILSSDLMTLRSFSEMIVEYHGKPMTLIEKLRAAGFDVRILDDYGLASGAYYMRRGIPVISS